MDKKKKWHFYCNPVEEGFYYVWVGIYVDGTLGDDYRPAEWSNGQWCRISISGNEFIRAWKKLEPATSELLSALVDEHKTLIDTIADFTNDLNQVRQELGAVEGFGFHHHPSLQTLFDTWLGKATTQNKEF